MFSCDETYEKIGGYENKQLLIPPEDSPRNGEASQPPDEATDAPSPDNPDPGLLIRRLYDALVELEALAITADGPTAPPAAGA